MRPKVPKRNSKKVSAIVCAGTRGRIDSAVEKGGGEGKKKKNSVKEDDMTQTGFGRKIHVCGFEAVL